MGASVRLGFLEIDLPTASEAQCLIMADLAERFGSADNNVALGELAEAWQLGFGRVALTESVEND